jgi:PHD/YefM family antitoxin component YafN of YafNO toxin-antitoxin module
MKTENHPDSRNALPTAGGGWEGGSAKTKTVPISYVRAHLPEMVASLGKTKHRRVIITRNGMASAVLLSPEELETLEIRADRNLMRSLLRAEEDERAQRFVKHEDLFK